MPTKQRITITDVARVTGVSPKSISRVINGEPGVSEETRQRILAAIADLGYVANTAARRLRGVSKVIGLITSGFEDYAGEVMRGMSKSAQELGYNLMLYVQHSEADNIDQYQALLGSGLLGGLLMVVPYDYTALTSLCSTYDVPYVLVDYEGSAPTPEIPTITVTNRKGVLEATRYLLALEHRRIGFITGIMSMESARERLGGYQDALAEIGLPFDPALVVDGNWTQESGYRQANTLLAQHPDLTAIVASDDITAFGAMDAIKDTGLRIGEDVSVIGFDDIPMAASVHPPLTTVRQPMIQMGETAVELLVSLLEGHPPLSVWREFSTELIVRGSTGKMVERRHKAR